MFRERWHCRYLTCCLPLAGVIFCFWTFSGSIPQNTVSATNPTNIFTSTDRKFLQEKATTERFDVLLNSYMRSGSTITGHLLGHRDDAFYFYEPFWMDMRFVYFKGLDLICKQLTPDCTANRTAMVSKGLDYLKAIYNCSFDTSSMKDFIARIKAEIMYQKSGDTWDPFLECKKGNKNRTYQDCVPLLIPACKTAKHRVTKAVRLSLETIEPLLRQNPHLKIIHLVRDPRGIIHSQIRTEWFPMSKTNQLAIKKNVESLCPRILNDIHSGLRLMNKYPDKVKIIQYEDFSDTFKMAEYLYTFLGMDFSEKYKTFANTSVELTPESKSDGNHPFRYRDNLSWKTIQTIDAACKDVYNMLGYEVFNNEQDLRNHNISAIKERLAFSVLNR